MKRSLVLVAAFALLGALIIPAVAQMRQAGPTPAPGEERMQRMTTTMEAMQQQMRQMQEQMKPMRGMGSMGQGMGNMQDRMGHMMRMMEQMNAMMKACPGVAPEQGKQGG